jgi:hypothetical protein
MAGESREKPYMIGLADRTQVDSTLVVSPEDFRLLEQYDDIRAAAHHKILKFESWYDEMTEEQTALVRKVLPYFTSLEKLVLSGD